MISLLVKISEVVLRQQTTPKYHRLKTKEVYCSLTLHILCVLAGGLDIFIILFTLGPGMPG